jgi:probable O-glycosylation ligase (exosortase A-associated)
VALVPMTALTVVFTHSRGGFLSLAAVTLYFIATSRRKVTALALVAAMALVGSLTVPASFYERIASIGDYQSDGSSMGRLNAWAASWRMANDHPFTGVGLDNFLLEFRYYAPDPEDMHVAHNTWLQILAETGYVGLTLYVLLHGATGFTLWRARRRARRHGKVWAAAAAQCLGASMLAFLVGGTFLNRAHFDLVYHLMAMSVALDRVLAWQIVHPNVEEAAPPAERAPARAVAESPEAARV